MIDIIKVQLFRLKKSVLFWVMLGVSMGLPILSTIIITSLMGVVNSLSESTSGISASLADLNITLSSMSGWAQITSDSAVLSVITSSIVLSKEFSDGTTRNILLAKKSRSELYFAYLIVAIAISLVFLTGNFVTTLIIVAPIFGFNNLSAGQATSACMCSFALGIVAAIFVASCMCMFLFSVRKTWATILFPLLICLLVPGILNTFITLMMAAMALRGQIVSTDSLRYVPFVGISLYDPASIDGVVVGMNILYLAVFTAMFVVIGYFTFKKADLK